MKVTIEEIVKMSLNRIHYLSGITITIFVGLHLFNHSLSVFGAQTHIEVMNNLRIFYRNVFVEAILLLTIIVQIVSGIQLFQSKRETALALFEKLQIWTGLYLSIFFIIHLSAVLGGRYFLHLDTNFYFGVAGLNTYPLSLFFVPYYGLAMFSFFGHVAAIHHKKMKLSLLGFTPYGQSVAILVFGIIFTIFIFYGLTNHFNGVSIPQEYDVLIGK